jgi:hypothetical protein
MKQASQNRLGYNNIQAQNSQSPHQINFIDNQYQPFPSIENTGILQNPTKIIPLSGHGSPMINHDLLPVTSSMSRSASLWKTECSTRHEISHGHSAKR